MAKATLPNTTALSVSEAAAEIVRMINSRPVSPRADEIAAVITRAAATPVTLPQLSPDHLEYRKIVAEIARFEVDGYPTGMTQKKARRRLRLFPTKLWRRAKGLGDACQDPSGRSAARGDGALQ